MIGCGTTAFTDPADYCVHVPGASIGLVLTGSDDFWARVTWVNMQHLNLVRVEESVPRVAFVSLVPTSVFVSFPLRNDPSPVWNGVRMRRGEIVLHAPGEHIHQCTAGATRWGLISMKWEDLAAYGRALLGAEVVPPQAAKFLRPPSSVTTGILRLHTQACHLAKTKPDMIAHREVARALEQDLIHALINGLAADEFRDRVTTRQRHAEIMVRFEHVLAMENDRRLPMSELCAAIGVPQRTLRICCKEFLGRGPVDYARLRRLNLVRSALTGTDPPTATVAAVARKHGFSELGRFAAAYRSVFGEAPSTTLHRGNSGRGR